MDRGLLVHAQQRVLVEVGLFHAAILDGDALARHGADPVDHRALALALGTTEVDDRAAVGPSLQTVVFVVMATSIPTYGRVARTQPLTLRNSEFILAERAMGASMARILAVHMLPNIIGVLAVLVAMDIPTVIALEAGLSFLGLGVKPPTPSWGALLKDGYALIRQTPWLVVGGGLPIVIATLGFTFLGESLRDVVDPKLRKNR